MRWLAVVAGLLLALAGAAQAQQRIGGNSGSSGSSFSGSSGSSFSGSSGGSFSGSSGSSFSGGSFSGSSGSSFSGSSSGSFSGSSGGFSGSMGGARTSTGSQSYGRSSVLGKYYSNPLSAGYGAGTSSSSSGFPALSSGQTPTAKTSTFGTPLVDAATLSKTSQLGTSSGQLGTSGLGQQGTRTAIGASSMGTRRSPAYLTSMGWQPPLPQQPVVEQLPQPQSKQPVVPQPTPVFAPVRTEQVQSVISSTPRLPSRSGITVSVNNDGAVVLKGTVSGERERRLAEAMARTAPGVLEVRNELVRQKK
jgi:osmotically-inducible protein OsmY